MKQMKILGVVAMVLTLGLAGCNNSGTKECEKHEWGDKVTIKEATCTEAGQTQRTCKVCGAKEEPKTVKALGHDMKDNGVQTEPTCEGKGIMKTKCSRCGLEGTRETDAAGHSAAPAADNEEAWTIVTPAKCEEAGDKTYVCEKCHQPVHVAIDPIGHEYADEDNDGEDDVVWTTEPTCEAGGVGKKVCTREGCGHEEAVEADPLGHKWQSKDGEFVPAQGEGYVDFYTYECANGCGQVSLGFKANQPTVASREHLVFEPAEVEEGEEQGARFWGRPIGNALALSSDGTSVNQQNGEVVYCSTETGDFFEYKFVLTQAQAQTLSTCRCYVDAKAANYLNGTDFWAYGRSNDEWTPGYYIDGGEGHYETNEDGTPVMVKDHARVTDHAAGTAGEELETEVKMGKRIEDYRYILYVDGNVCDFDPEITAPTHGSNQNMRREEFVMPYTFHLNEGENTISLRMAGGYRSLFYNFYFRQYVEPAPAAQA